MALNSYRLGELITQRREKKPENEELPIRGVSKDGFIPPKQIDADTDIYNVFYKKDFVYNPARMELGSIAFNSDLDKGICSSLYEIFFVHRTDICLPEYLALFVSQDEFARYCNFLSSGSAREYCRFANISQIKISLPSIEEQRKIVHDYKVVSDRIELLTKINEKSHLICEAIYEEMCSIGEEKCLGDIVNEVESGGRPSGGAVNEGIPSIGAEKIERFGVYNFEKECYIPLDYFNNMKRGIVKSKDVLLYKDGAYTGKVSMAFDGFPYKQCAVNEHVFILRTNSSKYQAFLYFVLNNHDVMTSIHNLAASKAAQPGLNQSELLGTKIILPNESILNAFEIRANPFIKSIKNNAEEIKILHEVKNNIILSISKEVA